MPKIEVKSHPETTIVGLLYHGKNQAGEIPQLWEKINQVWKRIQSLDESARAGYGINIMDENFASTLAFDYIGGFPILDTEANQPEDFVSYTIPGGKYAVITCPNLVSIQQAYDAVYNRWLPASDYQLDLSHGNFCFEMYGEEFMPAEGSEKFYIYVPVKEK